MYLQKSVFPPLITMPSGMVDSVGLLKQSVFAMSDLYVSPVQAAHVVPANPYPALQTKIYNINLITVQIK